MISLTKATKDLVELYYSNLQNAKTKEVQNFFLFKIRHTYAVLEAARSILFFDSYLSSKSLEFKKKCELAALLHDTGRFLQHQDGERIFKNSEYDHGLGSYEFLKSKNYTDPAVLLAVKYHNKLNLDLLDQEKSYISASSSEKKEIREIVDFTRDADKLQILQFGIYDDLKSYKEIDKSLFGEKKVNHSEIKEKVFQDFLDGKVINHSDVDTDAEGILNTASWIYDFNFEGTKKILIFWGFGEFICKKLKEIGAEEKKVKIVERKLKTL